MRAGGIKKVYFHSILHPHQVDPQVGCQTKFLHLLLYILCLGLIDLQDGHGMQSRSGLFRGTVGSCHKEILDSLDGMHPGGGILQAKMHCNRSLQLRDLQVPLATPTLRVVRIEEKVYRVLAEKRCLSQIL